jgi:hypothetical protein
MFYSGSGSAYIKRGMKSKNYIFHTYLWLQEEVLRVKKITDSISRSRIRKKVSPIRIPDPGDKKAPDLDPNTVLLKII